MRTGKALSSWVLMAALLPRIISAVEIDSDGDGVVDSEDPNPNNSQVVPWRSLASWRFSRGTLQGEEGQQPVSGNNAVVVPNGFQGPGVQLFDGSALRYRAVEPSGRPNIAAVRGSIFFRLKPGWSSGRGPGAWATVLQAPNLAVRVSPNGSILALTSVRAGSTVTNVQLPITARANNWSYGLVTYSPEETSLSFDAPSTRVAGPGIPPPAVLNNPDGFIAIGSAGDGTGAINGTLDDIVIFNAAGVLGLTPTLISAIASDNPRGINLAWISPTNAITEIRRRVAGASDWESSRAAFGTNFFDSAIVEGERYEYNVNTRVANLQTGLPDDNGQFIKATRNGTPLHQRGKLILLVDQTLSAGLEPELSGFVSSLVGDGWQVLRADVPRHIDDYSSPARFLPNYNTMVNVIKPFIRSNYAQFGPEIKQLLCLGHVPVPYTGTAADDGHSSTEVHGSHLGAWASDLFYGDVDGVWTDTQTATNSSFLFNWNVPGDGRLDQNRIPENPASEARLEIPVSRIDLAYMPAFAESETALLKRYLKKNFQYRMGVTSFAANAMAAEYVVNGSTLPAQLAGGMLSKVRMFGQPLNGDVLSDNRSFLFGVESGPGAFDRINDALPNFQHTTADVARGVVRANCAFYYLRGSYFPDWNTQNNFLRSLLTLPSGGLTASPFLFLSDPWRADGLGVGLSIGSEVADVVNRWSAVGFASVRSLEILGDPTLRYPVLAPPGGPGWTVTRDSVTLHWSAVPGVLGYYVYRSDTGAVGPFQQLTPTPVADTAFADSAPAGGQIYMVRAAALATTGGGTFTNLSQGVFTSPIKGQGF